MFMTCVRRVAGVVLSMAVAVAAHAEALLDVTPWVKQDTYERVKISPDGQYYAMTAPLEDRTALMILRRSDNVFTARIVGGANSVVDDFW